MTCSSGTANSLLSLSTFRLTSDAFDVHVKVLEFFIDTKQTEKGDERKKLASHQIVSSVEHHQRLIPLSELIREQKSARLDTRANPTDVVTLHVDTRASAKAHYATIEIYL